MGSTLRPVRGTHDFLPDESRRRNHIEGIAADRARAWGFGEVATPIFEFTEVFARTLGETTDIVSKEMYTFTDRGGESITLRPENTAGIVRACISNGLLQALPAKLFYRGPMFRYERPQKGRLRQFHQIGVELIGVADAAADLEVIALAHETLQALGLGETIMLEINTLGDQESRGAYREALIHYLGAHQEHLSPESQDRLARNPLRILDSKDKRDHRVLADAPSYTDALTRASRDFFATVTGGLEELGIPFRVNPRLVRGLDYYCHTVFEFISDGLGAQGTVLAGGRYDGLIGQMGGPATPGVGWAAGVERLMMLIGETGETKRPIAVIAQAEHYVPLAMTLARRVRDAGFMSHVAHGANLGKRMRYANRVRARLALIVGGDEHARGVVTVRDMDSGAQHESALEHLERWLHDYFSDGDEGTRSSAQPDLGGQS